MELPLTYKLIVYATFTLAPNIVCLCELEKYVQPEELIPWLDWLSLTISLQGICTSPRLV